MTTIGELCEEVKTTYGGVVTNLFKKLQIGGVREIFVLEFKCRIIIHFLETISRTICEELDNEMLTKGDKKLARSDKHFAEVMSFVQPSKNVSTVINSDDATTWAQRFVMPVFGCLLSRILPSEFITPVMQILNLITTKKLELPHQLLDLYDKHPDVEGFDDGMKELKRQYMGVSSHNDLLDPGSRMLKNKSNMMQGILHYTSSLLHCGYLTLLESISTEYISRQMENLNVYPYRYTYTAKVSSDDSSVIQTLVYPRREDDGHYKHVLMVVSEVKSALYPLMCAEQSVQKSTP
jgi:hypothetical protein